MKTMKFALAFTAVTAAATVSAQTAPAKAAVSAGQSYGDWSVVCQGAGSAQVCNAMQSLQDAQTKTEQVRLVVSKQKATGRLGAVARIPLGFRLDSGLMLQLNGKAEGSISGLIFSRCLPEGCFAEKPLSPADVNALRAAASLDVAFLDYAGKPVVVRMSTKGIKEALSAL